MISTTQFTNGTVPELSQQLSTHM